MRTKNTEARFRPLLELKDGALARLLIDNLSRYGGRCDKAGTSAARTGKGGGCVTQANCSKVGRTCDFHVSEGRELLLDY